MNNVASSSTTCVIANAAIALYESLGFNEATIRRNYYPTTDGREDAIIMALPISM
ncbi:hypothetical protein [Escherichia coli]|uniref:hypothetical protein n=1 Tax=Escherichia coli TaxID=562 RepID=UPI0039066729